MEHRLLFYERVVGMQRLAWLKPNFLSPTINFAKLQMFGIPPLKQNQYEQIKKLTLHILMEVITKLCECALSVRNFIFLFTSHFRIG